MKYTALFALLLSLLTKNSIQNTPNPIKSHAQNNNNENTINCPEWFNGESNEENLSKKFENIIKTNPNIVIQNDCISLLIKRGYTQTAKLIINQYTIPKKIDIVQSIKIVTNHLKQEIDKTVRISYHAEQQQILTPVYSWGQNSTHVLMQVKFAHRQGVPGCLDVWNKDLSIHQKFNQTLHFTAKGINGQIPLTINLEIPLFDSVTRKKEKSYFKDGGVGTIVIILKKIKAKIWKFIGTDEKSQRASVWWDLSDLYPTDMKKYRKIIDDHLYGGKV